MKNILDGFPIGPMPVLSHTITQKNHYKSENDATLAEKYFGDGVSCGRMVGPLSHLEVESLLGGCFQTLPVGVVPKAMDA
jgi:hypothetical protein